MFELAVRNTCRCQIIKGYRIDCKTYHLLNSCLCLLAAYLAVVFQDSKVYGNQGFWFCFFFPQTLMERRIRPWINKKIIEYIGEEEATLVDFVCSKVSIFHFLCEVWVVLPI